MIVVRCSNFAYMRDLMMFLKDRYYKESLCLWGIERCFVEGVVTVVGIVCGKVGFLRALFLSINLHF